MRSRIEGVRATAVRKRATSTTSTPIPITPEVCPIVRVSGRSAILGREIVQNCTILLVDIVVRCAQGSGAPVVGGVGDRLDQEVDDGQLGEAAVVEGTLGLGHPVDEAVVPTVV